MCGIAHCNMPPQPWAWHRMRCFKFVTSGSLSRKGWSTKLQDRGRLVVSCPDRPGIVAAMSRFLFAAGANIVQSDQYSTDPWGGRFFMRVEFELPGLAERHEELRRDFTAVAEEFHMEWELKRVWPPKRMAILVSRDDHCLLDLLWRWQARELGVEIPMVISNHPHLADRVEPFGIPFYHLPIGPDGKERQEQQILDLLRGQVDFVVLARYMQILTPAFLAEYPHRVINIHHSFLPAFVGARPYHQAYERGVKLIGATAHYATEDLDQGPIIEQDVIRVDHRDDPESLRRKGRDIERLVLARAVKLHEDRVIVFGNKTIVFA